MRAASVRLGVCDLGEQARAIGAAAAGASAARVEHRAEVGERAEREGRDGGGAAVEQPDIVVALESATVAPSSSSPQPTSKA